MYEMLSKRKLRHRKEDDGKKINNTPGSDETSRTSRRIKDKDGDKNKDETDITSNPTVEVASKSKAVTSGSSKSSMDSRSKEDTGRISKEANISQYDFELDQDFAPLKLELNPKADIAEDLLVSAEKLEPEIKFECEAMETDEAKDAPLNEKWTQSEKILCFHGPLIYEAKIQEVELLNSIPKYFIHYKGWNKNWDEWVPEARMLKLSPRNVVIQKDLCLAHEAKERSRKRKEHVFAVPKNPSPVPRTEKGRRKNGLKPKKREESQGDTDFMLQNGKQVTLKAPDSSVETEEQFRTKMEIRIKMPEELKSYIVDDWAQVCRRKKQCVLPARTTVEQLLSEYTRAKTANKAEKLKNNKEKAITEVTAGVREYFNVMLASQLLYRQERAQYEQLLRQEPGLVPCRVYGPVHLLRLFTKLGEMLVYTPLSEKSVQLLLFYVHDMLLYMKRNASVIFSLADYQDTA